MNVSDAIRLKRAVCNFTSDPLLKETNIAILHPNSGEKFQIMFDIEQT